MKIPTLLTFLVLSGTSTSCTQVTQKAKTYHNQVMGTEPDSADSDVRDPVTTTSTPTSSDNPLLAIHTPKPASCVGCHENKRLSPTHYAKFDCVSCHNFPSFKEASFSHTPKPETCEDCHARPATLGLRAYPNQGPPVGFDPNNTAELGSGHYRGKDCVTCHSTPPEGAQAFTFTHSKPNPGLCLPCHYNDGLGEHNGDGDIMLSGFGNCFNCHKNFDRNVNRNFDTVE